MWLQNSILCLQTFDVHWNKDLEIIRNTKMETGVTYKISCKAICIYHISYIYIYITCTSYDLNIADVYAPPKAQQQESCLDTAPTLLDVYIRWQGTKCFKTIRKRAKPDSNCSCACGALGTQESQMQATKKHFHSELMVWDSRVFGFQFGSIYQKGIFQSAGPIPKISKPPRPIHWWW